MKKTAAMFLPIFVLFLACNKEDKMLANEITEYNQYDLTVDGGMAKALYIATKNFYIYHYPIERYKIIIKEDTNIFYIDFLPKITDYETAYLGHQGWGNSVSYRISKKTYRIERRVFGK
jgi:hypothetical protein